MGLSNYIGQYKKTVVYVVGWVILFGKIMFSKPNLFWSSKVHDLYDY